MRVKCLCFKREIPIKIGKRAMVQRAIIIFILIFSGIGLFVTGCVSQTPVPQYAENIVYTVAYTHDDMRALTSSAVEEEVVMALNSVLTDRRLTVQSLSFSSIEQQMQAVRDTERRIQSLRGQASGSQIILLGEISTEFYSPLSGRYRWDVSVTLTIYDLIHRNTLSDKFTIPAALMYSHETGDDAIKAVHTDIQRHVGSLVDAFMKGRTTSVAVSSEVPVEAKASEAKGSVKEEKVLPVAEEPKPEVLPQEAPQTEREAEVPQEAPVSEEAEAERIFN